MIMREVRDHVHGNDRGQERKCMSRKRIIKLHETWSSFL